MKRRVQCFWLEPVEKGELSLRRWAGDPCNASGLGYHNASVVLGERPYPFDEQRLLGETLSEVGDLDSRWPKTCACGYVFRTEDRRDQMLSRLFAGAPDSKLYTARDMPPGSMFDADWWPAKGYDGKNPCVVLPDGTHWMPDSPATNGGPWQRSGTVPNITCRPSILTPDYHGFLTNGVLEEC